MHPSSGRNVWSFLQSGVTLLALSPKNGSRSTFRKALLVLQCETGIATKTGPKILRKGNQNKGNSFIFTLLFLIILINNVLGLFP
jgi:hypothetical protein